MSELTLETALDGHRDDSLSISRSHLCRLLAAAHSEGRGAGRVDIKRSWTDGSGDRWPEPPLNPFLGGPTND